VERPPNVSPPDIHTHIVKDVKDAKDGKDVKVVKDVPEPAAPTLTTLTPTLTTFTSPLEFVKDAEPPTDVVFQDNLNNLNNLNGKSDVPEIDPDDPDDLLVVEHEVRVMRHREPLPRRELIARNTRLWSH
jgi:hypothetical protein